MACQQDPGTELSLQISQGWRCLLKRSCTSRKSEGRKNTSTSLHLHPELICIGYQMTLLFCLLFQDECVQWSSLLRIFPADGMQYIKPSIPWSFLGKCNETGFSVCKGKREHFHRCFQLYSHRSQWNFPNTKTLSTIPGHHSPQLIRHKCFLLLTQKLIIITREICVTNVHVKWLHKSERYNNHFLLWFVPLFISGQPRKRSNESWLILFTQLYFHINFLSSVGAIFKTICR